MVEEPALGKDNEVRSRKLQVVQALHFFDFLPEDAHEGVYLEFVVDDFLVFWGLMLTIAEVAHQVAK